MIGFGYRRGGSSLLKQKARFVPVRYIYIDREDIINIIRLFVLI